MAEKNYNSLLRKLKELRSFCSNMKDYSPLQELITLPALDRKIKLIEELNFEIDHLDSKLNIMRQTRISKIKGLREKHGINGIIRLSRQAVNYVGAFGKEYYPVQQVLRGLICKMQPKGGHYMNGSNGSIPQSYDAITQAAEQFYLVIKEIPVYNPADQNISKQNFNDKVSEIKELSKHISETYEHLRPMIKQRYDEYHSGEFGIRKVFTEVKKYVRGNWGVASNEYKSIRDLKL